MARLSVLFFVSVLLVVFHTSFGQTGATDKYKLVWADEFNIEGTPDSSNWSYEKDWCETKNFNGTSRPMQDA